MKPIEERTVFVTDDGQQHATRQAAESHNYYQDLVDRLRQDVDLAGADFTSHEEIVLWFTTRFKLEPKP
jgi:hypothetical protein